MQLLPTLVSDTINEQLEFVKPTMEMDLWMLADQIRCIDHASNNFSNLIGNDFVNNVPQEF